jgi:Tfp pilus assembly protein PilE
MSFVDLLITVIVVTILVALAIGGVTYLAYRSHLARRVAAGEDPEEGSRYFVRYLPNGSSHPET